MKNLIKIALAILILVVLYFGFFDHFLGFLDRSARGTFTEEGYSNSLDQKSDLLPYDMVLLPDTDLKGKKIHAFISFHSYKVSQTQPSSLKFFDYVDDNSLAATFNELWQYDMPKDEEEMDQTLYKGGGNHYMVVEEGIDELCRYHVIDVTTKEKHTLNEFGEYILNPQVIEERVYYEVYSLKDGKIDSTAICSYDLKTKQRNEDFYRTQGTIMLMDVHDGRLLYKFYDPKSKQVYACLKAVNTSNPELLYEIKTDYYADDLRLIGENLYFRAEDDEERSLFAMIEKGSDKVSYFNTKQYKDCALANIQTNGTHYLCIYYHEEGDAFGVLFDMATQNIIKKYSNLRSIGLEGDNLYYIKVNRNSNEEIIDTKIVVEDLTYVKPESSSNE